MNSEATIRIFRDEALEMGLTVLDGPNGDGLVIFNLNRMERGCVQVKGNGDIYAAWNGRVWGRVADKAYMLEVMQEVFAA